MQRVSRWLIPLAAAGLATAAACAQQSLPGLPDGTGSPINSANAAVPSHLSDSDKPRTGIYRDLDLLRRNGFSDAQQASLSLRVIDPAGMVPGNLQAPDFTLIVNGTPRVPRVHAPGSSEATIAPMVLLVLPPNQPVVHYIAVKNAEKYFARQPSERLPWSVGIFDSNGKMTPFTNGRSQLLVNLDVVEHAPEPFQYANSAGLSSGFQWESSWMLKAEDAIGMMQRFDGPKVVLAINPLAENQFGLNDQMFEHDGPESLIDIAKTIGAHIYVANVGGPDVYIPGGGAADDHTAQINTPGGPVLGTLPSFHMQVDPQMTAAMNYFAYRTSAMMMTAQETLGGYANSLSELAGKIHSDLDGNYLLDFDLTPEDTDQGVPSVEVRMARHDLRVAILDLEPMVSASQASREIVSRQLLDLVRKATLHPVVSPEYRISQHVDYFPLREGLEPVLPMSGAIEWTGAGEPPRQLSVIESVEDPNLASVLLERNLQVAWNGRGFSWERDGTLRPGNYLWRIAVHDGRGHVFSSAQKDIHVAFPRPSPMAVSSLVLGKSCREGEPSSGLARRPLKPATDTGQAHLMIDPMHAADCRVRPEASGIFEPADTMHAFVRIYPAEKFDKHKPESWTAKFVLRSQSGSVEMAREMPFTVDSGSGYLASIVLPLKDAAISGGPHTLDVQMRGPGMHGNLDASRSFSIAAALTP
jgi:hypothetical protein